jgi:thiol-disulfide isomerase/thioredoxin
MIKRLLIFLITLPLFVLIALSLKSGDIKTNYKKFNERVSFEKNEQFNSIGLLNLDSTNVSDSIFIDKLTIVQFSFHGCGACQRDKQFFPNILNNTPSELQIITISIDQFDTWRKKNINSKRWFKLNIGQSNLKSELKIGSYPTYFVIDNKGKIISRPDDGIAYLRNYYNFKTTTNINLIKDYITHLKESKRLWNHILSFTLIYFLLISIIFVIISIVDTIRNKRFSWGILPKTILFYLISTMLFFAIVYFTDGREDIKRINTINKTGLGEVFTSFSMKEYLQPNQITLVHFFTLHNAQSNQDLGQIPKLLDRKKDIQILSICLNDTSIWSLAQTSDIYFPTGKENDSIKVSANFNSKRNDRWQILHGLQDTSWMKLKIQGIPTYLILDDKAKIIERPRRGIEFVQKIEYRNPSFAGFSKYIKKNGGWGVFFLRGIVFYILIIGLLKMIKFIAREKVHGGNTQYSKKR